jgi:hypothetical protein
MFEASHPFAFFDYFRVPYTVRSETAGHGWNAALPVHRLHVGDQPDGAARSLLWLGTDARMLAGLASCQLGRYELGGFTFFGHVLPNAEFPQISNILRQFGQGWHAVEPIRGEGGYPRAAVWQDQSGSIFLPFDPGEAMRTFWSEEYARIGRSPLSRGSRTALVRGYYLVRPAVPRHVQLRLRRAFARVQARSDFPKWPLEDSLDVLYEWLFRLVVEIAGRPVPFLDRWPDGRSWALVLTHDVETEAGCSDIELLRTPERRLGYRSSWNFVPLRYQVDEHTVRALQREGCEVGVHGLRHDGRDLGSPRLLARRLPEMRKYADRWQAVGFRSPATQRQWDLMPRLGFDYDSSYTDTDPYEPQPGGCCTYLPYFNENMIELPITLPQDHTMFSILENPDARVWLKKAQHLRERQGMVLALTHPDYARDERVREGYRSLLESFHGDSTVWHALPREVASWWRQRACSTLRRTDGGWCIDGPASARGRIQHAAAASVRV